ncbi:unnamed protein product [Macrosiphum euphorbiae]|uniref:Uncharacterized protein n=1 Tax=Macrosiphum euphorbiae TaxID=13131 RepID=A0AAV0WUF0_9HEMI|nr:unnamed protein product [Macrosiphum euphorbiae]
MHVELLDRIENVFQLQETTNCKEPIGQQAIRGFSFYKCKDGKAFHILSSLHSPDDKLSVNRKDKDGSTSKVQCPLSLKDYN